MYTYRRQPFEEVKAVTPAKVIRRVATRSRNPRGEGERLRVDLLDAAADLIAEHRSVDKVSLRAVAAAAGVSPMAVYNHFEDKDALMQAAVEHCWDDFAATLADAYTSTEDPYDRLRRAGSAYVDYALAHPGRYRVMFTDPVDALRKPEPVGMSAFDTLVEVVAAILDDRDDDREPLFVAVEVHTWVHGMVSLLACHPEGPWPPVEALLDDLVIRLELVPR